MGVVDGRIWAPFEAFYIHGMLFNAQSAFRSIARISDAFDKLPEKVTEEDLISLPTHAILNDLQNIIVNGAALSRYFWPVRKGHEERGAHIREALSITNDNPLYSRGLRNAIEHFDERLDKYLSSGIVGVVIPEYVGPKPYDDGVHGHFFRAFFTDIGVFRLLEAEHEIEPIAEEIIRINELLERADENGGHLPKA
jgi:hypothetical protein